MSDIYWHKMKITVPVVLEERGSALLVALGAQGVWVEAADHDDVYLNVFFPETVPVGAAKALIENAFAGLYSGKISISSERLPEEPWQTAWQSRSIPVQCIGRRLMIVPPWEKGVLNTEGRAIITLSPGMAFGTGTHATTSTCLEMLEEFVPKIEEERLLDVGTGSGVLAIAAAKLGVRRITATETDLIALSVAAKNARKNRVISKITFRKTIPSRAQYACVLANLTTAILLELREEITNTVLPGGSLILSGMLKDAHEDVIAGYTSSCVLVRFVVRENWVTLFMKKK